MQVNLTKTLLVNEMGIRIDVSDFTLYESRRVMLQAKLASHRRDPGTEKSGRSLPII